MGISFQDASPSPGGCCGGSPIVMFAVLDSVVDSVVAGVSKSTDSLDLEGGLTDATQRDCGSMRFGLRRRTWIVRSRADGSRNETEPDREAWKKRMKPTQQAKRSERWRAGEDQRQSVWPHSWGSCQGSLGNSILHTFFTFHTFAVINLEQCVCYQGNDAGISFDLVAFVPF